MSTLVILASAAIGGLVGVQRMWTQVIVPRRRATKLRRAYHLMEAWLREIDSRLEHGIDLSRLRMLEASARQYLKDHRLEDVHLKFTPSFRSRYLKAQGIRAEFHNDVQLFKEYARLPASGIDVLGLWFIVTGAFSGFHRCYHSGSREVLYIDVANPLKVLRLYLEIKEQ